MNAAVKISRRGNQDGGLCTAHSGHGLC